MKEVGADSGTKHPYRVSPSRLSLSSARKAVLGAVALILILTILEFPPPVGFATRPQSDVSTVWLGFFLVILIVDVATIPMVYKRPNVGGRLGILAAILNILQVLADQARLMQPEVAPFGYSVLEGMVVIASVALAWFSWMVMTSPRPRSPDYEKAARDA